MRISDWSSDVCSSDLRDDGPMNKSNNTMVVNCVAYSSAGERQDIALDDISETLAADSKGRSEEHTSELQSLMRTSYAVFCLKKKNKRKTLHRKSTQQTTLQTTTNSLSNTNYSYSNNKTQHTRQQ